MDGPRNQLLTDTAFPSNQHGGPTRCRSGYLLRDAMHDFASTDDFALNSQSLAELNEDREDLALREYSEANRLGKEVAETLDRLEAGEERMTLRGHSDSVIRVSFSPTANGSPVAVRTVR